MQNHPEHARSEEASVERGLRGRGQALGGPTHLVLFDGRCGLCDRTVQWLLRHDPEGVLHFAPLEGPTAGAILARHAELPRGLDSILFVERDGERERLSVRSTAIFHIVALLPGPVRYGRWLRWLPRPLTDLAYRVIARIRYRVWGRLPACRVPTPEEAARFLP